MPMNNTYLNAIGTHGATLITHIGLTNGAGTEISGGSYARQAVTWNVDADGDLTPTGDLTFNIPAGSTVGAWQGYSALTAGTAYGENDLTDEAYASAGTYTLLAASTAINHN